MDAIIFLAPISGFDQVLSEDKTVNRLVSSFFLVALILRLGWRVVRLVDLFDNVTVGVCSSLASPSLLPLPSLLLLQSMLFCTFPFRPYAYPLAALGVQ